MTPDSDTKLVAVGFFTFTCSHKRKMSIALENVLFEAAKTINFKSQPLSIDQSL